MIHYVQYDVTIVICIVASITVISSYEKYGHIMRISDCTQYMQIDYWIDDDSKTVIKMINWC